MKATWGCDVCMHLCSCHPSVWCVVREVPVVPGRLLACHCDGGSGWWKAAEQSLWWISSGGAGLLGGRFPVVAMEEVSGGMGRPGHLWWSGCWYGGGTSSCVAVRWRWIVLAVVVGGRRMVWRGGYVLLDSEGGYVLLDMDLERTGGDVALR